MGAGAGVGSGLGADPSGGAIPCGAGIPIDEAGAGAGAGAGAETDAGEAHEASTEKRTNNSETSNIFLMRTSRFKFSYQCITSFREKS
jgi:hypothetical protein